ncbi:hypothetical protein OOK58_42190 [Streptomyces sp. NBC_01728]|uniref:hypothetical protein n=1 Tax=unclassified Streptomyces TaxID=2593676 RepID=UPI002258E677|nr:MULTISPECIES: hypothetical protein [unclassified Streptomyces]MCX4458526.1 hypothetical protein [Streptomyces sp. NBC_01719]MCX4497883.1 hypothetical protein [Streptomyces sp. NBC_01728]
MPRVVRTVVYVLLLLIGLSAVPTRLYSVTFNIAIIGLGSMVLLQLRSTRNRLDYALAWVALWAVVAVIGAPFAPEFHALGELARGAL